jgi:hypothetical protein
LEIYGLFRSYRKVIINECLFEALMDLPEELNKPCLLTLSWWLL